MKIKSDQTDDGRYTIEVASHNVVPLTSNLTSPYSPPLQASAPPIILTNPFNSVTNGVGAAVVDAAFSQRRKMLRSALSSMCAGSEKASEILESAKIDPQLRGEALNVDDYVRLTYAMKKSGITINSTRS